LDYFVRVNMGTRSITEEKVPEKYLRLGGRALTAAVISNEVPAGSDPLGSSNKLVLAPGLLGGTGVSSSGRLSIGAKSPLTQCIKEANSGGTAGGYLARHGIRALIIEGAAANDDCYILYVGKDRDCRLIEADYKGEGVHALMSSLREKWGENISVVCIGPAGVNKMRGASISVSDPDFHPRFAARGGLGAVMGSKGLVAVVIESPGAAQREPVDKDKFRETTRNLNRALQENPKTGQSYRLYGTASILKVVNEIGCLPTRNFSAGSFEGAEALSGEALHDLIDERGGEGCYGQRCMPGCVIRCGNTVPDADGKAIVYNLQYETLALLGSNCGFSTIDAVARLNYLCNDIGLDSIEAGAALGVALEAGLAEFGDLEGAVKLLEEVRQASTLGRVIGNGALITGQVLGVERIPVSKGQAFPGYDPRALKGNGVTYATSPMGADHTAGNAFGSRATTDPLKKTEQVELSRKLQRQIALFDVLGLCMFTRSALPDLQVAVDLVNALYGWDLDVAALLKICDDLLQTEWAFNAREGYNPEHDRLPEIFSKEPLPPHNTVFDVDPEEMAGLRKFA